MSGSLKICQLTQLQASVTQDYFDKAEEESKNVQDIKYQEEVWQEIEGKQMQHFYMADWTLDNQHTTLRYYGMDLILVTILPKIHHLYFVQK